MSHIRSHNTGDTCQVSHVRCHMSGVTIFLFGQNGGTSRWRVCNQRGLPSRVKLLIAIAYRQSLLKGILYLFRTTGFFIFFSPLFTMSHVRCHMSGDTFLGSRFMCHMSGVTCQVSHVRCHHFFFKQSGGTSRWRVCYQWGLPSLVKLLLPTCLFTLGTLYVLLRKQ